MIHANFDPPRKEPRCVPRLGILGCLHRSAINARIVVVDAKMHIEKLFGAETYPLGPGRKPGGPHSDLADEGANTGPA